MISLIVELLPAAKMRVGLVPTTRLIPVKGSNSNPLFISFSRHVYVETDRVVGIIQAGDRERACNRRLDLGMPVSS